MKKVTNQLTPTGRRKVLKTLASGGGFVTALDAIPSKWARPVVDSVLLPAHAATSTTVPGATTTVPGATTTMCPPMTLLDLQVSCTTIPDPGEQTVYVVEETEGSCPSLVTQASFFPPDPTATKIALNRRRFYSGASAGTAQVDIFHLTPGGGQGYLIRAYIDNCGTTGAPLICDDFDQLPFEITGTMGGTYSITAQSSCDPGTGAIRIFNIVIQ